MEQKESEHQNIPEAGELSPTPPRRPSNTLRLSRSRPLPEHNLPGPVSRSHPGVSIMVSSPQNQLSNSSEEIDPPRRSDYPEEFIGPRQRGQTDNENSNDEYNALATYPLDYEQQSYPKIPGRLYYNGVFKGFDQNDPMHPQIIIDQNLEKVYVYWLVRNIKEVKLMSDELLHYLEHEDLPRDEEYIQERLDALKNIGFMKQERDSWVMLIQSEVFHTIDGSFWVLRIYPNGNDLTLPAHFTVSLEIWRPEEEADQFFMKKVEFEICAFLVSNQPKSVKKDLIFRPGLEQNCVTLEVDYHFVSPYIHEFFKNSALFQINMQVKPISPEEWNRELNAQVPYISKQVYEKYRREELAFSGIQNSGMMCYLISLMQTYFHIPAFRDFVFNINTEEIDTVESPNSLPLALQKLFYNLSGLQKIDETRIRSYTHKLPQHGHFSRIEVIPNMIEVGISLKNQGFQDYQQEDISEFLLRITDELERITLSDYNQSQHMNQEVRRRGAMYKLFNGDTSSLIQCQDFPMEPPSVNTEIFAMLQLQVLNTKNIKESLIKFMAPEKLCGNNKYHSEKHGLQNAWKWQEITSLPPVLFLTLKRFNFFIGAGQKVNTRFEFSQFLDMDAIIAEARERQAQEMGVDFSSSSEIKGDNKYRLLSIMMHAQQDIGMGHYYAYIKPHIEDKESEEWLEFNDFTVRPIIKEEAFEKAFGGQIFDFWMNYTEIYKKSFGFRKYSAYMLCYLRERDLHFLLKPVHLPMELSARFEHENEMSNAISAKVSTSYTTFHVFAMSNQTLAGWSGFGPLPPSQFGVSINEEDDEEQQLKIFQDGIFRTNRLFRFKDQIPKTVCRNNRQISMFAFQDYHRLVAKRMNLPLHSIRLWLCSASRYNPEIMCVSSFVKSDLPTQQQPHDFLFDGELEVKQAEMLNTNCENYNGGIFIELVERQFEEWKVSEPVSDAVVFVQKEHHLIDKEEEIIQYYRKHPYEGRRAQINIEVQNYCFAAYNEKEEKQHGLFRRVPESWRRQKIEEQEEQKKYPQIQEEKGTSFEFVFQDNNKISKVGPNTPKTESGGPTPPLIGNPEREISVVGPFSPHDKQEKSESVLGEIGELDDDPPPNLSPVNNNDEDQENINPGLISQDFSHIKDSTMLRTRKQKIREEHKLQREQYQSSSLYRLETKAKLIFIKVFLNGNLTLTDVRGMTFPSLHSEQRVLGREVFARYIEEFMEDFSSINIERFSEIEVCVYREARIKELKRHLGAEQLNVMRQVDLDAPIYNEHVQNGDCYIISTPEPRHYSNSSFINLKSYLANNILRVKVEFHYKTRKFENLIIQDKWMQQLRGLGDSPYSGAFILDVKLTTSLQSLAQRLQNQKFPYTPSLAQRIVFYKEKEIDGEEWELNPQVVISHGKRDKCKKDKVKESIIDFRKTAIKDLLISNERILFNVLPFFRRECVFRSSFQLCTVLVSSLTNSPYLQRSFVQNEKDQESAKTYLEYACQTQESNDSERKAYQALLIATVWQSDCVANLVEARKYSTCTAGDLKQEIFKILSDYIQNIGKANAYARNQKLPIRFKKTLELKSVSQLLILREASLKKQQKPLDLCITERVILKIFTDEQKVWMIGQENKQISDLNSNIRVLIVPFQNPLWHHLEHNLWPSRYPQFPVSPRLKEALEQVLDEKGEQKEQKTKVYDSPDDHQKLNQYFTLKFEHPKCFFVQCRVVEKETSKFLSDIFLLPYHTDAASVSSFLWNLCSSASAPVIRYRNKKNELIVLEQKDLLNNVSYQIVNYKLTNPQFFRRLPGAANFNRSSDSHKKPFLRREHSTVLALKHPLQKRFIGKSSSDKKFPFMQMITGTGSTLKEAFSLDGSLKYIVPSPLVLEILVGKDLLNV